MQHLTPLNVVAVILFILIILTILIQTESFLFTNHCLMNNLLVSNLHDLIIDREKQIILYLLICIEEQPETTQKDLSERLGVAVSLINSYIKRLVYKGYIKTQVIERRRQRYQLTPAGHREKVRLQEEFLRFTYQYIREIRAHIRNALEPYRERGLNRVIFLGTGEMAELVYLSLLELKMDLAYVIDPEQEGQMFIGTPIRGQLDGADPTSNLLILFWPKKATTDKRDLLLESIKNQPYVLIDFCSIMNHQKF